MTHLRRGLALLVISSAALITTTAVGVAQSQSLGPLFANVPRIGDAHAHQARATYVGQARHSNAYVAFVVSRSQVLAYVCDGAHVAAWLHGTVSGSHFSLKSSRVTIEARLAHRHITGTVSGRGVGIHSFTAVPAIEGKTGLFRGSDPIGTRSFRLGWIWLGRGRGLRGADTSGGVIAQPLSVDFNTAGSLGGTGGTTTGGSGGSGNSTNAVDCNALKQDYDVNQAFIDRIDAMHTKSKPVLQMRQDAEVAQFDDIAAWNNGGCPGFINH